MDKSTATNPQSSTPVSYTDVISDTYRIWSTYVPVRVCTLVVLGDGKLPEDGIYVLLKEVIDNSIDEFKMNAGDRIEVDVDDNLRVSVRDYGRGIPQESLLRLYQC